MKDMSTFNIYLSKVENLKNKPLATEKQTLRTMIYIVLSTRSQDTACA